MRCEYTSFSEGQPSYIIKNRILEHEELWLRCKDVLKEGCIPLETFDNMTRRRISRIIERQEERLRLQQEYLENERKKQEKKMKK